MATGTTYYVITPDPPATLLVDGDHFVLIPDVNSELHAQLEVKNCTGSYPIVRWLDKIDSFVAVGDDFLVKDVATGMTWNADMASFVVDAQAVNIHGWEWLNVDGSTTVDRGTARLVFKGHGLGTVNCDLTGAREFSSLVIHNADLGRVNIRAFSLGGAVKIWRQGVLLTFDLVLNKGETARFSCFEENEYTCLIVGRDFVDTGDGPSPPTDHGSLTGLLDDDHPQYLTDERGDNKYPIHTYTEVDYTQQHPNEIISVNSLGGPVVITLLASPNDEDYLKVMDVGDSASWNNISILRNGKTIISRAEDALIDMSGGWLGFIYDAAGDTWELDWKLGCDRVQPTPPINLAFQFVVTTDDVSFALPLPQNLSSGGAAVYDFFVDWGDGTAVDHITAYNQAEVSHSYVGQTGDFIVSITGRMDMWNWLGAFSSKRLMVTDFINWGDVGIKEFTYMFFNCANMSYSATDAPIIQTGAPYAYSLYEMFTGCAQATGTFTGDLSTWDLTGVTEFSYMFRACQWNPIGLENWDVSPGTDFASMFEGASNFNRDIGSWDVSNGTDFSYMLAGSAFNKDISAWTPTKAGSGAFVGFSNFLNSAPFSTANYDLLLNAWSLLTFDNTTITFRCSTCFTAQAAHDILTDPPNNWTITDEGVCPPSYLILDPATPPTVNATNTVGNSKATTIAWHFGYLYNFGSNVSPGTNQEDWSSLSPNSNLGETDAYTVIAEIISNPQNMIVSGDSDAFDTLYTMDIAHDFSLENVTADSVATAQIRITMDDNLGTVVQKLYNYSCTLGTP